MDEVSGDEFMLGTDLSRLEELKLRARSRAKDDEWAIIAQQRVDSSLIYGVDANALAAGCVLLMCGTNNLDDVDEYLVSLNQ